MLADASRAGVTLRTEGYANWQADGLENRCPKGLVGSSPTPSARADLGPTERCCALPQGTHTESSWSKTTSAISIRSTFACCDAHAAISAF